MLDFMRKNANSWVMILLFGIIIFVFAINFGPWAGNVKGTVPYAALINNEPISLSEFRTAYGSQFARIKQFRPDYDQTQADRDGLKQIVIDQLISRELLTQLGKKQHFAVSPKYLADEIKLRVFGEDADFDRVEYVRRVNSYFQAPVSQFEEQVAKEIIAEKMAELLSTAVSVSDSEILTTYKDKNTKIAIEFVKINPSFYPSEKVVTPEEAKAFADANPKRVSDFYNENIGEYVKDEEIRASHILVKAGADASETDKAAAKEKAQKILDRIKNNEDFATIAKAESDDPGSKAKGGDLDFFSRGMMVEEFAKAAFALKTNEVSAIVESPFGFHIIKKVDERPKTDRKLEEVATEIAEKLIKKDEQQAKAKDAASLALNQLKSGTTLDKISVPSLMNAKAASKAPSMPNAPVADETDLFSRTSGYIQKIGRADVLAEEAFKLSMDNKTPANVIESNGEFFAIRLKSRQDADMTKYEEQKESIRSSILYPRKRSFMQQYIASLKESAKITYNQDLINAASADS